MRWTSPTVGDRWEPLVGGGSGARIARTKLHNQHEPRLSRVDAVSGGQRGQAARSSVEGLVGSRQRGRNGGCSQPGRPT
jgi:hypothetical protein